MSLDKSQPFTVLMKLMQFPCLWRVDQIQRTSSPRGPELGHRTEDPLLQKSPLEEIGVVLFDLCFVFRHRRAEMPSNCKGRASSLCASRGLEGEGKAACSVSDWALVRLLVTLLGGCLSQTGLVRPKQQTQELLYTIDHAHLFRSQNVWLHQLKKKKKSYSPLGNKRHFHCFLAISFYLP